MVFGEDVWSLRERLPVEDEMRRSSTPLIERFWQKVSAAPINGDDCWEWIAGKSLGYGRFAFGGSVSYAHRWSYERFVGPIPEGMEVDHLCGNRGCVNPMHLEAITGAENKRRAGQRKTHCIHGHEYTAANTYRDPPGGRRCRTCASERQKAA